jgi:multiple sugar transport system permease protein
MPRRPPRYASSNIFPKKSVGITLVMGIGLVYALLPLYWLLVNASKTQSDFFSTFGLWFGHNFALWDNIVATLTYQDGAFGRWLLNTLMYVVLGAGGSAIISTLAGYGLAHYAFRGRRAVIAVIVGAIAIPGSALAVPTFLLFSAAGLTNTPIAVIIPSLLNPFGLFLIWVYAASSIPKELLEAARVDGASELRAFVQICLRLLAPGFVTVLLFSVVSTWNNYFLPLIMLSDSDMYTLPVGLASWSARNASAADAPIYNLVLTGSLLTVIPIVVVFLLMQRFWQSGLATGSVKL